MAFHISAAAGAVNLSATSITGSLAATRLPRSWKVPAALLAYCLAAFAANWPTWPGSPDRIRAGDLDQMTWFLSWVPNALLRGHNPLFTNFLNYPRGVNLEQNTVSPLLGIIAAPLTLTVNSLASLNLLMWLAYPLSAAAMFFALRRFVASEFAAFIGGAIYGFSPYIVDQGLDHLNLAFVPLPPLILLAIYETVRADQPHRTRWALWLALTTTAQFFITSEVAFTTVLIGTIGMLFGAISHPREIVPTIQRAWRPFLLAVVIVAAFAVYPVWALVDGPYRYNGPAYPGGFSADLLSLVIPTSLLRLVPHALALHGDGLMGQNTSEQGAYVGVPLLVVIGVLLFLRPRTPWLRFALVMAVISAWMSLGQHIPVNGHTTGIPTPFWLVAKLPLADNVLASRLSLFTDMFIALAVCVGLNSLITGASDTSLNRWVHRVRWLGSAETVELTPGAEPGQRGWHQPRYGLAAALVIVIATSWFPSWPFTTSTAGVPSYFSSASVKKIKPGSVTLISPYPSVAETGPMLWQAVAQMRFRMIGGYALFRGGTGGSTNFVPALSPVPVEQFLWAHATGGSAFPTGATPALNGTLVCQTRTFLLKHHVSTVLAVEGDADPTSIAELFTDTLGAPAETIGPDSLTSAWYDVPKILSSHTDNCG